MGRENYYRVTVFVPDAPGSSKGTTTDFGRYAKNIDEAMASVADENPDVVVQSARCVPD